MASINQTLTAAGPTATHVTNSNKCLLAVIAATATTLSVQLEAGIGADWVPVGTPLTAVGSAVIDVPDDTPVRAALTGTGITSVQIGIAT